MTDPESPDHELEARLIRAGMRETPPPGTLQRTLAGLGLGASALGAVSSAGALGATKAAASVTAIALTKWTGFGVAAGFLFAAATHGVYSATRPATQPAPISGSVTQAGDRPKPAASAVSGEPFVVGTPSSLVLPAAPPSPPRSAPASPAMEPPLAAEVSFVDRGREAFQRGEPAASLALLDSYERLFPELRLMPEVLYLRMQAFDQRGETRHAAGLAARLVRDFPKSPHASSARAILERATGR
jgi:hypothetical protein